MKLEDVANIEADYELIKVISEIPSLPDMDMRKYDDVKSSYENRINGHREKAFYRIKSNNFPELLIQKRFNRNNRYKTYMDKIFESGETPEYLSAIMKESQFPRNAKCLIEDNNFHSFKEVMSSRILSFFGLDTPYETLMRYKDKPYVFSVDFVAPNEEFYNFDDLRIIKGWQLEEIVSNIDIFLSLAQAKKGRFDFDVTDEVKKSIIEDYIYSRLVRKTLLHDYDARFENIGLRIDKESNEIKSLLNIDFEQSINRFSLSGDSEAVMLSDLECVKVMYPRVYERFYDKLKEFSKVNSSTGKPIYATMAEDVCLGENLFSRDIIETLGENISELNTLKLKMDTGSYQFDFMGY